MGACRTPFDHIVRRLERFYTPFFLSSGGVNVLHCFLLHSTNVDTTSCLCVFPLCVYISSTTRRAPFFILFIPCYTFRVEYRARTSKHGAGVLHTILRKVSVDFADMKKWVLGHALPQFDSPSSFFFWKQSLLQFSIHVFSCSTRCKFALSLTTLTGGPNLIFLRGEGAARTA